jgi:hypothetical protein
MVTQSTIFSIIIFDYQVVIINITIISDEHNDITLLRLYTPNKPHPYLRVSRRFESIVTLQGKLPDKTTHVNHTGITNDHLPH